MIPRFTLRGMMILPKAETDAMRFPAIGSMGATRRPLFPVSLTVPSGGAVPKRAYALARHLGTCRNLMTSAELARLRKTE